jgi:hypothetical protein
MNEVKKIYLFEFLKGQTPSVLCFTFVVVLLDHLPDSPSGNFVAAIVQRLFEFGQIYRAVSVFVDLKAKSSHD